MEMTIIEVMTMLNVTLIVVDFIFVLIGAGFCAFMLLVWLDVLKQNDKINEEVKQDDET